MILFAVTMLPRLWTIFVNIIMTCKLAIKHQVRTANRQNENKVKTTVQELASEIICCYYAAYSLDHNCQINYGGQTITDHVKTQNG